MAAYKIISLGKDYHSVKQNIQKIIKENVNWQPATSRTPGAVWDDISKYLSTDDREILSKALGRPLHDIFWMTDYRNCKSLEVHKDNPGNEFSIRTIFTLIFMVEGTFEITIWDDDQTKPIEKAIVNPGEFIVLNNCQYYHSGKVTDGKKLSLHAYPIIDEIDNLDIQGEKFQVDSYIK